MKKRNFILLFFICSLPFASCDDNGSSNEDKVQTVEKDGSIEMKIVVTHLTDSTDLATTLKNIWIKNVLKRQIVDSDTIPSLGLTTETGENEDGDDTTVTFKKNYQIFITVK